MSPLAAALVALALAQAAPDASESAPAPPSATRETSPAPTPPPAAPAPPPATAAPPPAEPVPPVVTEPSKPLPSLLSAEPLRGTSLFTASFGWPGVRAAYAQGLSPSTDLGGFVDFDYSTTELRAGVSYRGQVIPRAPPFDGALRLSLAWYHDSGGRWLYHRNHPDEGLELGVGVSYSRRGAGGVVSLLADAPLTVTFRKDGGALLSPRAAFAYETPLYGKLTIGLQLGLGVRAGIGNAPLKRGMAEVTILGLVSDRLF